MPNFDLKAYARRGAEARIAELTAELNEIYRAFPDLRRGSTRQTESESWCWRATSTTEANVSGAESEISKRMKKYWAERRKVSK